MMSAQEEKWSMEQRQLADVLILRGRLKAVARGVRGAFYRVSSGTQHLMRHSGHLD